MKLKLGAHHPKILKRTKRITGVVTPKAMPGRKKGRT
jgi:hypothetical protein